MSAVLALPDDEIHLWWLATEPPPDEAWTHRRLAELSASERARYGRFRRDDDRHRYLLAHALLRRALSGYCPRSPAAWRFAVNTYGKPVLEGAGPRFNLSHAEGLVACALSGGIRLGVDVEREDRPVEVESLAGRWLAPEERRWLAGLPAEARGPGFLRLWTLKEAYLKALGRGLSASLSGFALALEADGQVRLLRQDPAMEVAPDRPGEKRRLLAKDGRWQFARWSQNRHSLAVVALLEPGQPGGRVVRRDARALMAVP